MAREDLKSYPFFFILYYLLYFSGFALYGVFIPIYLDSIHYSQAAIGFLISIGPVATVLGQPIWGAAGDRSKNKADILRIILLGIGLSVVLFGLSTNYFYLLIVMSALTFFQSALGPTSDAITLEYTENTGWKYGPIRASGTLGYAIMAAAAGIIIKNDMHLIFILYMLIIAFAAGSTFMFPRIPGHQSGKSKVSLFSLLKNREMFMLMLFVLVTHTFIGFYNTFFPIYFKHLGSGNALVGISVALAAVSELPFIFFGDRILEKLGVKRAIFGSVLLLSIRWLLMSFISNPYIILFLQVLHGPSLVFLLFSMVVYVSKKAPKELRSSGQALYAMVYSGLSRIIGSAFGGFLSDKFGIQSVFLTGAVVTAISLVVFKDLFRGTDEAEAEIETS
ncbi:MAG: MFS transporter [Clostridia bacterium]|nr:MFS transporter [Clostridia bacterium]